MNKMASSEHNILGILGDVMQEGVEEGQESTNSELQATKDMHDQTQVKETLDIPLEATTSRPRRPTEVSKDYGKSMLSKQFNDWVKRFYASQEKLDVAKVTCEEASELRLATRNIHEIFENSVKCCKRLEVYVNQSELIGFQNKLKEMEKILHKTLDDIADVIKNLSLEQASRRSFSSKNSRRSTRVSQLGEERIKQLGKAAALQVELSYERQERELTLKLEELRKKKQIASLHAEIEATKKAEAKEFGSQCSSELPRDESRQEKEDRILKSMQDCFQGAEGLSLEKTGCCVVMEKTEQGRRASDASKVESAVVDQTQVKNSNASEEFVSPKDNRLLQVPSTMVTKFHVPGVKMDIFDGKVVNFPVWESAFDALIGNRIQCPKHKMNLMGQYLVGEPKDLVSGLLMHQSEDAYNLARQRLKSRYGNPSIVCQAFLDKLSSWPKIGNNQPSDLQRLSDFLVQVSEIKRQVNSLQILDFAPESSKIVQKLPLYLQHRWRQRVLEFKCENDNYPAFQELVQFVEKNSEEANIPELKFLNGNALRPMPQVGKREFKPTSRAFAIVAGNKTEASKGSCHYCKGPHHIDDCSKVMEITQEERFQFLKGEGLCFGCGTTSAHLSRECKQRVTCKKCQGRHLSILHIDTAKSEQPNVNAGQANVLCTEVCGKFQEDFGCDNSMILPVWVRPGKNVQAKEILCYCILDSQSNTCFISDDLQEELGIEGCPTNLTLSTIYKSNAMVPSTKVSGLEILSYDKRECIALPPVYTRDCIPASKSQIPIPETAEQWKHLSAIKDKIVPFQSNAKIGILIGNNVPGAIRPREIIAGKEEEPYAQRTLLGWGLVGLVCRDLMRYRQGKANAHRIVASPMLCLTDGVVQERGMKAQIQKNCKFALKTQVKEVINPATVRHMMEVDFVERDNKINQLSAEDRRFLKILSDNIYQQKDGHYVMPLPVRSEHVFLPNNKALAVKRALHLKRRFFKDSTFQTHYNCFMEDVLSQYAEKVPDHEERSDNLGRINYVPHTGVYHARKPNKIRVVFDCSATFQGVSLNNHLLSGPNLTNGLTGILCRFRKEQVAIMMDIKSMFHQFIVKEQDRDLLRFLWWEDGDTSKPLQEYRMKVHLFGATSSPGCANFGLKRAADDGEEKYGHTVAGFVREDFYVDDGITSVPTVDEAISLAVGSIALCDKAGMKLHKFMSNKREVLHAIPESHRADEVKSLDLSVDALPIERTLGIDWCVENDNFKFRILIKNQSITRRGILSAVSSIYDPLGFIAPVVLRGKKILQELCRSGASWDDVISEELTMHWRRWITELLELEKLEIRRCYKPENFGTLKSVELHHFSDASEEGYGQCSYLRLLDTENQVHCSFVIGKARVAPLKQVSVPRLELTAALVSARMSVYLRQELKYPCVKEIFWVDSKVVLGYLNNEAKRFQTFVANRVQEIRDITDPSSWYYVESKSNPSDEASRGVTAKRFVSSSRWLQGPEFLWKDVDLESKRGPAIIDEEVQKKMKHEMRKATAFASTVKENDYKLSKASFDCSRLKRFSSWFKAKRAVANCMLYQSKLDAKRRKLDTFPNQLYVSHFQKAETVILKGLQQEHFAEEMHCLNKGKELKQTSTIYRLNPFIDENGILRVGGRLCKSHLPDVVKHPAIIPKKGHVTNLIINYFHEKCNHMGRGMTLNSLRQNGFWLIGGTSRVSSVIKDCIQCKRQKGMPCSQKMADLPLDRLAENSPFTSCGMDVFGPFYIKEKRSLLKRYGLIFTCMASRAIHLESINSLDTSSFINGLRRFLARRGPVQQLRCDCGTNFVGANNELRKEFEVMNSNKVKSFLLQQSCDWFPFKFNVPHSSHMGGVWERQIRTVRNALQPLVIKAGSQLDDESFRTFLTEVENIVNSRPLSIANLNDTDCLEPLTPNHILTMKPRVLLSPPGSFPNADLYSRRRWKRVQHMANEFWFRWRRDYLDALQTRNKWCIKRKNLKPGDIVVLREDEPVRNKWPLAKVIQVFTDDDGLVRKVRLLKSDSGLDSNGKRVRDVSFLDRPIHKLVFLFSVPDDYHDDEQPQGEFDSRRGANEKRDNVDHDNEK